MSDIKVQATLELDAKKSDTETKRLVETLETVKKTISVIEETMKGVTAAINASTKATQGFASAMQKASRALPRGPAMPRTPKMGPQFDAHLNARNRHVAQQHQAQQRVAARAAAAQASRRDTLKSNFAQGMGGGGGGGGIAQMLGIGAALLAARALTGVMASLVSEAAAYSSEIETAKISIGAVLAQVEGTTLDNAMGMAGESFDRLQTAAIRGVGELQDYIGVFSNIVAPARAAGLAMEDVEKMTGNAVTAAAALGVDFQQASRDMSMMATGVAGTDVKLFRIMHNMGAISQSAKEFNALTAPERLAIMQRALAGFSEAAERYSRTWPGILSTFADIRKNLTAMLVGPLLGRLQKAFFSINEKLLANFDRLKASFGNVGQMIATKLGPFIDKAVNGLFWVIDNFDVVIDKALQLGEQIKKWAPTLLKAAIAWRAIGVARAGVGMVAGAVQGGMGLANMAAGGVLAAGGGGAAVAGGTAAAEMSLFAESMVILAPLLAPVAAILAAIGVAFIAIYDVAGQITPVFESFQEIFSGIFGDFMSIGESYWSVLHPVLGAIGEAFAVLGTFLGGAFMIAFRATLLPWRILAALFDRISPTLNAIYEEFKKLFADMMVWLGELFHFLNKDLSNATNGLLQSIAGPGAQQNHVTEIDPIDILGNTGTPATPGTRAGNHYDFRGSKISVKQDFRDADPDRVAIDMISDLARFADQKIQSGFSPAL